ncbi:MAG: hypothetical protein LBH54_01410, partial [Clostridiales bacterium]|nr:hypothetical protein [Clostridiales bacterium]
MDRDLKKIHYDAFQGKDDYIPLTVKVAAPSMTDFTNWDDMNDPEKAIQSFTEHNRYSLRVTSDWVPVMESNFMESLIPSLFGAEIYRSAGGLIDVKAFIKDIYETEAMTVTDLYGGQTERALSHLRHL